MKDRRIWIDVTDFLRWRGALTGFQHIQYNIAKQCIADGRNVSYFVYDEPTHSFREVEFDPDSVVKDGIIGSDEPIEDGTSLPFSRRALRALKRRTPARIKRLVKQTIGHQPPATTPEHTKTTVQAPFGKDEVVLVLGGIWHGSFAADMAAAKKKKKFLFVHIIHDMIPVRVPGYVVEDLPTVFGTYKKIMFGIADGLLANSQSSKRDAEAFMREHNIAPPPISVFRIADEPLSAKPMPRAGVPKKDFILSVGTIEVRKNHMLLYYVYKQAIREGKQLPPLIIAGRNGWLTDDLRYLLTHDPEVADKIFIHNGVTNSELTWLYQHCLFTVWPSFYEGWGMPVAESMSQGKLCLASDTASMPEIAPGLVEHFSPYDSKQCLDIMVKYLKPDVLRIKEQKIKTQYKTTSWRDTYRSMIGFIDSL